MDTQKISEGHKEEMVISQTLVATKSVRPTAPSYKCPTLTLQERNEALRKADPFYPKQRTG